MEESIPTKELPEVISATIKKEHPKAIIDKCERLTCGAVVSYELRLKDGKKTVSLELSTEGKVLRSSSK